MNPAVFILSFNGINHLNSWFNPDNFKDIDVFIVDNGQQLIPDNLKQYAIHTTEKNIFCAGGWNLSAKIAFNSLGYEKIVITQDDLTFTKEHVINAIKNCDSTTIVGGRGDMFFYSFFAIHKNTYELIGEFDENFLFVTCEDNDYYYRASLKGIIHRTLNQDMPNLNLTSKEMSWKFGNHEYLISKWGPEQRWGVYTYTVPFNGAPHTKFRPKYSTYFDIPVKEFMSDHEFKRYLTK